MGSVFGIFTAVRCGLEARYGIANSIGSCVAGAVAVGAATAVDKPRIEFLSAYFADTLKAVKVRGTVAFKPTPSFVIGASAFSGAIMIGGADTILRHLGWQW